MRSHLAIASMDTCSNKETNQRLQHMDGEVSQGSPLVIAINRVVQEIYTVFTSKTDTIAKNCNLCLKVPLSIYLKFSLG